MRSSMVSIRASISPCCVAIRQSPGRRFGSATRRLRTAAGRPDDLGGIDSQLFNVRRRQVNRHLTLSRGKLQHFAQHRSGPVRLGLEDSADQFLGDGHRQLDRRRFPAHQPVVPFCPQGVGGLLQRRQRGDEAFRGNLFVRWVTCCSMVS